MKKKLGIVFVALLPIVFSLCACSRICKHKLVKVNYTAETCTEDGNIEYWHCSLCDKNFADADAAEEISSTVIPAAHAYGDYEYDFENKRYFRSCSRCDDIVKTDAGNEQFPLLARDETELTSVIQSAKAKSHIKLANDITVTAGEYEVVLRLPDGGTLDLGGHTVTVKNNGGFLVEGTDVTLQNGKVITDFETPNIGYAVFLGDAEDDNRVTVRNLDTKGGFNVFNCEAAFYDCNVDATNRLYYALWADTHSTITVNSGVYRGGKIACVHSTASREADNSGYVVLNGGTFYGKIYATFCTTINGGDFDDSIVLTPYLYDGETEKTEAKLIVSKDYASKLNIIVTATDYEMFDGKDANGNRVYETRKKQTLTNNR